MSRSLKKWLLLTASLVLLPIAALAATVSAPPALSVPATNITGSYTVSWTKSPTVGATYELSESTNGTDYTVIFSNLTVLYKKFVKPNGTYYYKVRANVGADFSAEVGPKACAVTLTALNPGAFSVPPSSGIPEFKISWVRSGTAGAVYEVEYSFNGGAWTPVGAPEGFTTPTMNYFTFIAPASGTYTFRVRATQVDYLPSAWVNGARACVATFMSSCGQCHLQPHGKQAGNFLIGKSTGPLTSFIHDGDGGTDGVPAEPDNGCESCHGDGSTTPLHYGRVDTVNPGVDVCVTCHAERFAQVQASVHNGEGSGGASFETTSHATGVCQRCHTAEGSMAFSSMVGDKSVYVGIDATNQVPAPRHYLTCGACHDVSTGKMNKVAGWDPNSNGQADQFDLCTGCHVLKDAAGKVYASGTEASGTGSFYHNDRWNRIIATTHYDNPATTTVVEGYNIRANGANPCFDCHGHELTALTGDLMPSINPMYDSDADGVEDTYYVKTAGLDPAVSANRISVRVYSSEGETIHTQWAQSAHAGGLIPNKMAAVATTDVTGYKQGDATAYLIPSLVRDTTTVDAMMGAGAVDAEIGNAWVHYNWDATYKADGVTKDRADCQRCHTSTGISNFLDNPAGYVSTANNFSHLSNWAANTGSPQNELLYCWGCHSNAEQGTLRDPGAITEVYAAVNNAGTGTTGTSVTVAYPNIGPSNVCMGCHLGREVGANITNTTDADGKLGFINSHYLTAGATVFSQSGYEYSGQTYPAGFHQNVGMSDNFGTGNAGPCVTCHMTGAESHKFEVLDAAGAPATTVCANCHSGLDADALTEAKESFETALHELQLALEAKGIYYYPAHPYFFNAPYVVGGTNTAFTDWDVPYGATRYKEVMGAAFNYNLLHHDPGAYAHNRQYALKLINDSIDYLFDRSVNGVGGTFLDEAIAAGEEGNHVAFDEADCTTCHTSGLPGLPVVSPAAVHAVTGVATIEDLTVNDDGTTITAEFDVKIDGVLDAGYTTVGGNYRFHTYDGNNGTRVTATGTLTNLGGGSYRITTPKGAENSRYIYSLSATGKSTVGYVMFDYPAAIKTDLVNNDACVKCHSGKYDAFHSGGRSNPMGVQQCFVCHNRSSLGQPAHVADMIHGIHASEQVMPTGDFDFSDEEKFKVSYPTYMNNCSVCHTEPAQLTTVNAEPVSYDFCMTCHENWDGFHQDMSVAGGEDHTAFDATEDCASCHDGSYAPATVAEMHNGLLTGRSGLIWDGIDVSAVEGAKIATTISSVARSGNNVVVTWSATYDGNPVDPEIAAATASNPSWKAAASSFALVRAWGGLNDWTNDGIGATSPGQPLSTNLSWPGNTTCADSSPYTCTTTVALTAAELDEAAGRMLGVALQGCPNIGNANAAGGVTRARAPSAIATVAFRTDDGVMSAAPRRAVVDTAGCLNCHTGSLYQHGGNRIDNVDFCVFCHNEASSEQNARLLDGVDSSEAYDGRVGQTYGFKSLLHAVHSANENNAVTMVYRTMGNYVWTGEAVGTPPNYPTADVYADGNTGKISSVTPDDNPDLTAPVGSGAAALIYGSSAPHGTGPETVFVDGFQEYQVYRSHNLYHPTYPQTLKNCMACHKSGAYGLPDATKAIATTVDAGTVGLGGTKPAQTASNVINSNLNDDIVAGPAAAACFSCHQSGMAPADFHGTIGGFAPANFGARDSVPAETCGSCHTP